jgi:hypothetical protein
MRTCCDHEFEAKWYRIVWSGRFKLQNEICKWCGLVREKSYSIPQQRSTYPSKEWIRV